MTIRRPRGAWLLPAIAVAVVVGVAILVRSLEMAPVPRQAAVLPGLTAEDSGDGSGIIVTSVQSASAAARAGISVGDRITSIGGHPVTGLAAARNAVLADRRPFIDMQLYHYHYLRDVRLVRAEEPQHVAQDTGRGG